MTLHALAVVDDPIFDEHRPPSTHPERPERLAAARRAADRVTAKAPRVALPAREASDDELARLHTSEYIEMLGRSAGAWHSWDEDTYAAPGSVTASRRAAGGAIELVDALLDGRADRGVALLRPPGHHARPSGAMGFCLLNNIAIAAAHARRRGAARVLIVDFDVHHGNGTQEAFYRDPSVLFVSTHQFPLYPGTGSREEVGGGEGRGYTVNIPLSAGAGDAVYAAAFSRIVAPIAREYSPDLVLLSAGFDAHRDDPLAEMQLSARAYSDMLAQLLRELPASARIGMLLEGGYDLEALEASLVAALESLVGAPAAGGPGPAQHISPVHEAEIGAAFRAATAFWPLG
ncbi:MAG TPA: histone deacetylase [Polyangiaceae bacterium]